MMSQSSIWELVLKAKCSGVTVNNIFHYRVNPLLGPDEVVALTPTDFLQTFRNDFFRASLKFRLSEAFEVEAYYVVEITGNAEFIPGPPHSPYIVLTYGQELSVPGGVDDKGDVTLATSDCLPTNSAVSWVSRAAGRSRAGRGGKRFAGIPETHTTQNRLTAPVLGNWTGLANSYTNGLNLGDPTSVIEWKPVIFNRTKAYKQLHLGEGFAEANSKMILETRVHAVVSTQKSRQERFAE